MKNKSTLLNISNNEYFLYLGNHWRKKTPCKNILFKNKIEKSLKKSFRSDQIRENVGIGC